MPYYSTVQEARNFLKVQTSEWSDIALNQFIQRATVEIDDMTTRTWQSPITETDYLYDGSGTDLLFLDHTDVQSISSLAIRESPGDSTATYTSVTTTKAQLYKEGYIILYTDAEVVAFTAGPATVKMTYIHGATYATALNDITDINTTDTSIVVDSTTGFPNAGYIIIDDEWIQYSSKTSTSFTASTRGAFGTTAAIHLDNATIYEAAPENIRQACLLLVASYMNGDRGKRSEAIQWLGNEIWKGPIMV